MRRGQLQGLPSATILRKDLGYQFAHQLGCQIPLNSDKVVSLSEIIPQENIVIKPLSAANSEGVYLVKPGYEVTDLNRGEILKNWENLQERLSQDLEQGTVDKDQWIVQELIYEDAEKTKPGRDLKFYCFYGRVALVLEICRFPERQYCWWNRNLDEIETGRYENQRFSGQGVTQEQLKFVESLSDKIPSAFVRIDFLKSWQGLVFCEFAPTFPGGYHNFKDSIDQWLGNCFLDAEGRLMKDLLQGKRFEEFSEIYDRLKGGVSLTSASEREESFKSHKAAIFKNCSKSAF
nr:ATP-grasp fold amidoligase family protein [Geitlerinema sp. P-1104]